MGRNEGIRRLRATCALAGVMLASGCASSVFKAAEADKALDRATDTNTPLISDYAFPLGLRPEKVEAVALVTGLNGTGEDPPQSPQRAAIFDEMKRRRIEKPNEVLRSPNTAIVLLQGLMPPGIQKGDRFDVAVLTPSRSNTKSLRGGTVLAARMTELAVLGQQIRAGHVRAMAQGPILVDPSADGADGEALAVRGRILGGGVARQSRDLGLVLSQDHQSVRMSAALAKAINDRFQTYFDGQKVGVAEAKTEEFIALRVHPRYKDNITRFVRVVRSLAVRESPSRRQERLQLLQTQLLDPLTAATAALRLEAIGGETAIEKLLNGIESDDAEVRFYSAEALAYLDQTECVPALAAAAESSPAFRAYALAALSAMDDVVAYDSLRELLSHRSSETRYGAFRALWAMNPNDPLIRGERLGGSFGYHVVDMPGPSMIHATRSGRPELVLFGGDQRFDLPMVLDAGDIIVNGLVGDEVTVSRFRANMPDLQRTTTTSVDEVVRAIVEVGGEYPDVVQALQQAKRQGVLASRFRVDAIPQKGREYDASDRPDDASDEGAPSDTYRVSTPLPDLFSKQE